MGDKTEIVDTVEATQEIKLEESEGDTAEKMPEFKYLAISKEDYEKFITGVDILSDEMKMYIGTLLHNKFKVIPLSEHMKENE